MPAKRATKRARAVRGDSMINTLTGLGDEFRDKRLASQWIATSLTIAQCETVYRSDALAARIVETLPNEMLRQGYDVQVGADGLGTADPREVSEAVSARMQELGVDDKVKQALYYKRAYGGSAIFVGAVDGAKDLKEPLREGTVSEIRFLNVLRHITGFQPVAYYNNPTAPQYGEPSHYEIRRETGRGGVTPQVVHESRLIIFRGVQYSPTQVAETGGLGDSVLVRVLDKLRDYNGAWDVTGALLQDFAQAVYKVKGLQALLDANNTTAIRTRLRAMEMSRSAIRGVLVDADGEDFKREQTPMAGLPEILDGYKSNVAAAADGMPVTLLMGDSAAGLNATGKGQQENWDDRVAAAQKTELVPPLERICKLVMLEKGSATGGKEPAQWCIKPRPLRQPTQMEIVAMRKTQMETDTGYIAAGSLTQEEVTASRFGGDEYSIETTVDMEARAALAAPVPVDGEAAPPATGGDGQVIQTSTETVLNGAQVTAATAIVVAVAAGEIPRDSGIGQLQVLFNLTPETAAQIMGSAGTNSPTTPNPKPAGASEPSATPSPFTIVDGMYVDRAAADRRTALVEKLGGKCVDCGTTERLEFDHKKPRTWVAGGLSHAQRIENYEKDAAAGDIVLRCRVCNAEKGKPE